MQKSTWNPRVSAPPLEEACRATGEAEAAPGRGEGKKRLLPVSYG